MRPRRKRIGTGLYSIPTMPLPKVTPGASTIDLFVRENFRADRIDEQCKHMCKQAGV